MLTTNYQIIIGIVFAIILLIIIAVKLRPSANRRRATYTKCINESCGTFDDKAAKALENIDKIEEPNAEDNIARARILELNIAQDPVVVAQNPNLANDIIQTYSAAINQINNNINTQNQQTQQNDLALIDIAGDFADRQIQQILFQQFENAIATDVNNIAAAASTTRKDIIEHTAAITAQTVDTKADFAKAIIPKLITFTSDPQNVHDPSVRVDNNNTIDIIRQTASKLPTKVVLDEIKTYIPKSSCSASTQAKALKALSDFTGVFVSAYNTNDVEILKLVWDRAHWIGNTTNKQNIKDAIVEALSACVVNDKVVCVNGRVSNVLGALATLDADKKTGTALTSEQYKNEILRRCLAVFDSEITTASTSDDPEMRKVGLSYTNSSIIAPPDAYDQFSKKLKSNITKIIDEYREKLGERMSADMQIEAEIAIAL